MPKHYRHNPLSLLTEVLASVARCKKLGLVVTVGQVERHLINIRVARSQVVQALNDLHEWGLLTCTKFDYRKNVRSCAYDIDGRNGGHAVIQALIQFHPDISPYFPEMAGV